MDNARPLRIVLKLDMEEIHITMFFNWMSLTIVEHKQETEVINTLMFLTSQQM